MRWNRPGSFAAALCLLAAPALASETTPEPLALIKQMDAAMRNFGPGTVDIVEDINVSSAPRHVSWALKMNGWSHFVESMRLDGSVSDTYQSVEGRVEYEPGARWFLRREHEESTGPFSLTVVFPLLARPEGWSPPAAKAVLAATMVVAAEYDGEPAWRMELPVNSMGREIALLSGFSLLFPLRSLVISRADALPRAWTGGDAAKPSGATYRWRRNARPYTDDQLSFHTQAAKLEVSVSYQNGRTFSKLTGDAPDFSLGSAIGRAPVQLSHLRGRPVLLVLKTDAKSLKAARRFYTDFHGRRLAVLVVTTDTPAAVRKALPKGGVPFPVLADKDGKVSAPYNAGNVDVVLIGEDGRVLEAGHLVEDAARFRSRLKAMP